MSGTILRRRDRTARPPRVEHYSSAVNSWDPETRRRPRMKAPFMAAATFRHVASRNFDPQLHTHAVIANMTRDADGC